MEMVNDWPNIMLNVEFHCVLSSSLDDIGHPFAPLKELYLLCVGDRHFANEEFALLEEGLAIRPAHEWP